MRDINKDINTKDAKINHLTQILSNLLKTEEADQNTQLKEVSDIKIEINNLKRKHNKKIQELEKESDRTLICLPKKSHIIGLLLKTHSRYSILSSQWLIIIN